MLAIIKKVYGYFYKIWLSRKAKKSKGWKQVYLPNLDLKLSLNLDNFIDFLIYENKTFSPEILERINYFIKKENITNFIDVGSNLGLMSLFVAKKFPSVEIISFEAIAENVKQQETNMLINGLNYELYTQIVSETKGLEKIYKPKVLESEDLGKFNAGMYSIEQSQWVETDNFIEIQSLRLDDFLLEKYITLNQKTFLIKIDVEGAELKVIKGLEKVLALSKVKLIMIIEIKFDENKTKAQDLIQIMTSYNFKIYDINYQSISNASGLLSGDYIFTRL